LAIIEMTLIISCGGVHPLGARDAGRQRGGEGQRRLAGDQRFAAEIIAVKLDHAEEHAVVVMAVAKPVEARDAVIAASDHLAVDDKRA
jgi:hypothetical protein